MNLLKYISLLSFVLFLAACADESPFEIVEEDLEYAKDEAEWKYLEDMRSSSSYMSEEDKCYFGLSDYSDSWCCNNYGYRCSYVSSSSYKSSSSSATYYLTSAKTMELTLTYYKQVSSDWDGLDGAGDPEVSFTIYIYSDGVSAQTISTTTFIDLSDKRVWSGRVSKTYTINKGTDQIKICPKVIDEDLSDHDVYSSGKCFQVSNIGYLTSSDVKEQTDYNSDYNLIWEWFLY